MPARSEQRLNLRSGFIFDALPGWDSVFKIPIEDRIELLGDPATRERLQTQRALGGGPEGRADRLGRAPHRRDIRAVAGAALAGRCVADVARGPRQERVRHAPRCIDRGPICDTVFMPPVLGLDDESWRMRAEAWREPQRASGSLGCRAPTWTCWPRSRSATHLLSEGVRERELLPLEEAVRLAH